MGSLKKIVAFLLCAVLLMGVMAGCAQKEPAQETTSENETTQTEVKANETETTNETKEPVVEKKTIKFWNGFTGSDQETLTKRIEEYNAGDHSATIEMEIMPWDTLYEKLATTVSSGEGPDVVAFSFQRIGTYAREGVIVPINDVFDNGVDKDVIPAGLLDNLNYGDDVYATPMNLSTMMLYYNKDLLAEAGLETPPANWDELSEYAKQLTKVNGDIVEQYGFGIASHVTVAMWPVLLWTGGGDIVDYSTMTSVLNSDANKYTMTYFSDLIKEYKVSPAVAAGADIDTLFQTGKCAMYMCGPWAVAGFQSAGLNFDVAPVPEGPSRLSVFCLRRSASRKTYGRAAPFSHDESHPDDEKTSASERCLRFQNPSGGWKDLRRHDEHRLQAHGGRKVPGRGDLSLRCGRGSLRSGYPGGAASFYPPRAEV